MRLGPTVVLLHSALILGLCPVSHAAQFDFTYAFPLNGVPNGVTASGILTTTPFDPVAMDYTIVGISGSRTVAGVTDLIASLLPPGTFGVNDNLLFPSPTYLNGNGFSFSLATGGGDNGLGDVNVFSINGGAYTEASSQVGLGSFTITPVPEPMPPTAALLAITVAVHASRKRRKGSVSQSQVS